VLIYSAGVLGTVAVKKCPIKETMPGKWGSGRLLVALRRKKQKPKEEGDNLHST